MEAAGSKTDRHTRVIPEKGTRGVVRLEYSGEVEGKRGGQDTTLHTVLIWYFSLKTLPKPWKGFNQRIGMFRSVF